MESIRNMLKKGDEAIASLLLIITSLLVFSQVICRYFFNYSISWSEEIARILIVWFIFLGSSIAVKQNAHVSMDIMEIFVKGKKKTILDLIINVINLFFCVTLLIAGLKMCKNAIDLNLTGTSTPVPLFVAYGAIPVGMLLMGYNYIKIIIEKIRLFASKDREVKE
ncbi:MAG: TRAP transporter small permease [Tissierellia bacterium]|nr:TRAP transporter small permease [Tissierellia bacterium]